MSPYEHFFWNYALFYHRSWAWKVGLGGLFPDLVYLFGFIPRIFQYGSFIEWMQDPFWDVLWNSPTAKSVHSFLVWGLVSIVTFSVFRKNSFRIIYPFFLGWGLHIASDALTHVSDGYALFYPLSDFRFPAPVSYWQKEFHAKEYFWISHTLMACMLLIWSIGKLRHFLKRRS
ncbi:MAG: metal-dependent hydrolase [Deltaproteobacteria bacterium]|nr:metal-dependent hydrolase [Deltaproteobacteria bacterium]